MTSLACQKRPGTADAPPVVGGPVVALAVSVMVVPTPAWPQRGVDLEHRIDNTQRVFDKRIVRAADSIPNEFQEPRINDFLCRKLNLITGTLVCNHDRRAVGVFINTTMNLAWIETDVVTPNFRNQCSLICRRPTLNM